MALIIIKTDNEYEVKKVLKCVKKHQINFDYAQTLNEEEKLQHIMNVAKDYSLQEIENLLPRK